MDKEKQKALQTAGFRVGDAEDFLGLTEEEKNLVELRLAVSRAIRRRREQQQLTQEALATRIKSSQSRVAKIEAGSSDVSLDLLFRSLFAVGGGLEDISTGKSPTKGKLGHHGRRKKSAATKARAAESTRRKAKKVGV
jgi:transcriptional regulator with XRE-family HTH domain